VVGVAELLAVVVAAGLEISETDAAVSATKEDQAVGHA
jgi:hypothetical protein